MRSVVKRSWSLQTRILLLTFFISASLLAVTAWLTSISSVELVERALAQRAVQALQKLTSYLERVPAGSLPSGLQREAQDVLDLEPSIARVEIFAMIEGRPLLIGTSSILRERQPSKGELLAFQRQEIRSFVVDENDRRELITVYPFAFLDRNRGFMTVTSSLDLAEGIQTMHSRIALSLTLVALVLLVVGITIVFRTTVYRPVTHLIDVMSDFEQGRASARAEESLPGEFTSLARQLNQMLDEIQDLNQHMQERVDQATTELGQRADQLEALNTRLYESQRHLAEAERLALAGQLTAKLAHDVGSPLGSVSTHLQLLLEEPGLKQESRRRIQLASEQIDRVCGIVEGFLSTTRVRAKVEVLDLREVIAKVEALLRPTLSYRSIDLEARIPEMPCWTEGDSDQLQQVMLNLLNNAVDSVKMGGRIQVSIEEQGASQSPGGEWRITVWDNGPGIPGEHLKSVFEPFFSGRKDGGGTGLGLSICREIVANHRGEIFVESDAATGTSFVVRLPKAAVPPNEAGLDN